jgi:hypothetical protein
MTTNVSVLDIAKFALELYQLDPPKKYSDQAFKQKFAFAFDMLVDADVQLQKFAERIAEAQKEPINHD